MLTLSNLVAAKGSKKKKRRVGRGNASGKGNYSGRGMKGQRARSGGKNKLVLKGVKTYLQRIPKSRGFKSLVHKIETINIGLIDQTFNAGAEISPAILAGRGLIKTARYGVKILGEGKITKKFTIKANQFSKTAKDAILKAGGRINQIQKIKLKNKT